MTAANGSAFNNITLGKTMNTQLIGAAGPSDRCSLSWLEFEAARLVVRRRGLHWQICAAQAEIDKEIRCKSRRNAPHQRETSAPINLGRLYRGTTSKAASGSKSAAHRERTNRQKR